MTASSKKTYYRTEREMYPDVIDWFRNLLSSRFPRSEVTVFDTSRVLLRQFIKRQGLQQHFPDHLFYEIQVDITGIVKSSPKILLAFVECKLNAVNLRDVSQLLGYSRVARPSISVILSPKSCSRSISYLIETFGRTDVLQYDTNRRIRIAKWDTIKKDGSCVASLRQER